MPCARRSRYNSLRCAISFIWFVTDVWLVTRKLIAYRVRPFFVQVTSSAQIAELRQASHERFCLDEPNCGRSHFCFNTSSSALIDRNPQLSKPSDRAQIPISSVCLHIDTFG